jgi:SAM-dependent methyltransferase/HEAT repeat protein
MVGYKEHKEKTKEKEVLIKPAGIFTNGLFMSLLTILLVVRNVWLDSQVNYVKKQGSRFNPIAVFRLLKKSRTPPLDLKTESNLDGTAEGLGRITQGLNELKLYIIITSESQAQIIRDVANLIGFGTRNVVVVKESGGNVDPEALSEAIKEAERKEQRIVAINICITKPFNRNILRLRHVISTASRFSWINFTLAGEAGEILGEDKGKGRSSVTLSNSCALDTNSLFSMPHGMGVALFKDKSVFERYLKQAAVPYLFKHEDIGIMNIGQYSVEGSKGFQALELWLSLMFAGKEGLLSSRNISSASPLVKEYEAIYELWKLLGSEDRENLCGLINSLVNQGFLIYFLERAPLLGNISDKVIDLRKLDIKDEFNIPGIFPININYMKKVKNCGYQLQENLYKHLMPRTARAVLLLRLSSLRIDIFSIDAGQGIRNGDSILRTIIHRDERLMWESSDGKGLRIVARNADITEIVSNNLLLKFERRLFGKISGTKKYLDFTLPRGFLLQSIILPKNNLPFSVSFYNLLGKAHSFGEFLIERKLAKTAASPLAFCLSVRQLAGVFKDKVGALKNIVALSEVKPSDTILDISCNMISPVVFSRELNRDGKYIGLDNLTTIQFINRLLAFPFLFKTKLEFIVWDINLEKRLPFEDSFFNKVILSELPLIIYANPAHREFLVREIDRILKPGEKVVCAYRPYLSLSLLFKGSPLEEAFILQLKSRGFREYAKGSYEYSDGTHVHQIVLVKTSTKPSAASSLELVCGCSSSSVNEKNILEELKAIDQPLFNLGHYLDLIEKLGRSAYSLDSLKFLMEQCINSEAIRIRKASIDALVGMGDRFDRALGDLLFEILKICDLPYLYKRSLAFIANKFGQDYREGLESIYFNLPETEKKDYIERTLKFLGKDNTLIEDKADEFIEFHNDILTVTKADKFKILDIASGTAEFVRGAKRHLWAQKAEIVAIDNSEDMIALAFYKNLVEVRQMDWSDLEFIDNSFHLVTFNFPNPAVGLGSLQRAFQEAYRVCMDGGGITFYSVNGEDNGFYSFMIEDILAKAGFDYKTIDELEGNEIPKSYPETAASVQIKKEAKYLILSRKSTEADLLKEEVNVGSSPLAVSAHSSEFIAHSELLRAKSKELRTKHAASPLVDLSEQFNVNTFVSKFLAPGEKIFTSWQWAAPQMALTGIRVAQGIYPVKPPFHMTRILHHIIINGKTYYFGMNAYVNIEFPNKDAIYLGNDHQLDYSHWHDYYGSDIPGIISEGGKVLDFIDYHKDGHTIKMWVPGSNDIEEQIKFGITRLRSGNFLSALRERGLIKKIEWTKFDRFINPKRVNVIGSVDMDNFGGDGVYSYDEVVKLWLKHLPTVVEKLRHHNLIMVSTSTSIGDLGLIPPYDNTHYTYVNTQASVEMVAKLIEDLVKAKISTSPTSSGQSKKDRSASPLDASSASISAVQRNISEIEALLKAQNIVPEDQLAYYQQLRTILNPCLTDVVICSSAGGPDILYPFLATFFTNAYSVDMKKIDINKLRRHKDIWAPLKTNGKYFSFKYKYGFSHYPHFAKHIEFFIIQELRALGALRDTIEVKKDGLRRPYIKFTLEQDSKERKITFIKFDLCYQDPLKYQRHFDGFHETLDVLFQKAAMMFQCGKNDFIAYAKDWVKEGGKAAINPFDSDGNRLRLNPVLGDNFKRVAYRGELMRAAKQISQTRFNKYGWFMSLWEKVSREAMAGGSSSGNDVSLPQDSIIRKVGSSPLVDKGFSASASFDDENFLKQIEQLIGHRCMEERPPKGSFWYEGLRELLRYKTPYFIQSLFIHDYAYKTNVVREVSIFLGKIKAQYGTDTVKLIFEIINESLDHCHGLPTVAIKIPGTEESISGFMKMLKKAKNAKKWFEIFDFCDNKDLEKELSEIFEKINKAKTIPLEDILGTLKAIAEGKKSLHNVQNSELPVEKRSASPLLLDNGLWILDHGLLNPLSTSHHPPSTNAASPLEKESSSLEKDKNQSSAYDLLIKQIQFYGIELKRADLASVSILQRVLEGLKQIPSDHLKHIECLRFAKWLSGRAVARHYAITNTIALSVGFDSFLITDIFVHEVGHLIEKVYKKEKGDKAIETFRRFSWKPLSSFLSLIMFCYIVLSYISPSLLVLFYRCLDHPVNFIMSFLLILFNLYFIRSNRLLLRFEFIKSIFGISLPRFYLLRSDHPIDTMIDSLAKYGPTEEFANVYANIVSYPALLENKLRMNKDLRPKYDWMQGEIFGDKKVFTSWPDNKTAASPVKAGRKHIVEINGLRYKLLPYGDLTNARMDIRSSNGMDLGFIYGITDRCFDGQERFGLRGMYLLPESRGNNLSPRLIAEFIKLFPTNWLHKNRNPLISIMLSKYFGFNPINPDSRNLVYVGRANETKIVPLFFPFPQDAGAVIPANGLDLGFKIVDTAPQPYTETYIRTEYVVSCSSLVIRRIVFTILGVNDLGDKHRVTVPPESRVSRLTKKLADPNFDTRRKAARDLKKLGFTEEQITDFYIAILADLYFDKAVQEGKEIIAWLKAEEARLEAKFSIQCQQESDLIEYLNQNQTLKIILAKQREETEASLSSIRKNLFLAEEALATLSPISKPALEEGTSGSFEPAASPLTFQKQSIGWKIKNLSQVGQMRVLGTQGNFFQGNLFEGSFISQSLERINYFNAGKFARGIIIGSDSLGNFFSGNLAFLKHYIKGVNFRVICNTHYSSLSKIINIHGYYYYFIIFFYKYRLYLFSLIKFVIPGFVKNKILGAFQFIQARFLPPCSPDSFKNLFFSSTSKVTSNFSVFAKPDKFFHKRILPYNCVVVKFKFTAALRSSCSPVKSERVLSPLEILAKGEGPLAPQASSPVVGNTVCLSDLLEMIASEHLVSKAKRILTHEREIKAFLGIETVHRVRGELVSDERSCDWRNFGIVFKFVLTSGQREISFYAKLRHSQKKIGIMKTNPTDLEHKITLQCSREQISPATCIVADTLLVRGIDNGISLEDLNRMPNDSYWRHLFSLNEEYFIRRIGVTYANLHNALHVCHGEVIPRHIFITKEGGVYLIGFSTEYGATKQSYIMGDTKDIGRVADLNHLRSLKRVLQELLLSTTYEERLIEGYNNGMGNVIFKPLQEPNDPRCPSVNTAAASPLLSILSSEPRVMSLELLMAQDSRLMTHKSSSPVSNHFQTRIGIYFRIPIQYVLRFAKRVFDIILRQHFSKATGREDSMLPIWPNDKLDNDLWIMDAKSRLPNFIFHIGHLQNFRSVLTHQEYASHQVINEEYGTWGELPEISKWGPTRWTENREEKIKALKAGDIYDKVSFYIAPRIPGGGDDALLPGEDYVAKMLLERFGGDIVSIWGMALLKKPSTILPKDQDYVREEELAPIKSIKQLKKRLAKAIDFHFKLNQIRYIPLFSVMIFPEFQLRGRARFEYLRYILVRKSKEGEFKELVNRIRPNWTINGEYWNRRVIFVPEKDILPQFNTGLDIILKSFGIRSSPSTPLGANGERLRTTSSPVSLVHGQQFMVSSRSKNAQLLTLNYQLITIDAASPLGRSSLSLDNFIPDAIKLWKKIKDVSLSLFSWWQKRRATITEEKKEHSNIEKAAIEMLQVDKKIRFEEALNLLREIEENNNIETILDNVEERDIKLKNYLVALEWINDYRFLNLTEEQLRRPIIKILWNARFVIFSDDILGNADFEFSLEGVKKYLRTVSQLLGIMVHELNHNYIQIISFPLGICIIVRVFEKSFDNRRVMVRSAFFNLRTIWEFVCELAICDFYRYISNYIHIDWDKEMKQKLNEYKSPPEEYRKNSGTDNEYGVACAQLALIIRLFEERGYEIDWPKLYQISYAEILKTPYSARFDYFILFVLIRYAQEVLKVEPSSIKELKEKLAFVKKDEPANNYLVPPIILEEILFPNQLNPDYNRVSLPMKRGTAASPVDVRKIEPSARTKVKQQEDEEQRFYQTSSPVDIEFKQLIEDLRSPDWLQRERAIEQLGYLKDPRVVPYLTAIIDKGENWSEIEKALIALDSWKRDERVQECLLKNIDNPILRLRSKALMNLLLKPGKQKATERFLAQFRAIDFSGQPDIRTLNNFSNLLRALGLSGNPEILPDLLSIPFEDIRKWFEKLGYKYDEERIFIPFLEAIVNIGARTPEVVNILRTNLKHSYVGVRRVATQGFVKIALREDSEFLLDAFLNQELLHQAEDRSLVRDGDHYRSSVYLRESNNQTIALLAQALVRTKDRSLVPHLLNILSHPDKFDRSTIIYAANILAEMGTQDIIP